jgi:O-antigen ligase
VGYSRDGSQEMWKGLTTHKNNLGQVAMSSGVYFSWNMIKNWGRRNIWGNLFFLLMVIWLLQGSSTASSKTAIFGFGIGVCVMLGLQYLRKNIGYLRRYTVVWLALLVFLAMLMQFGSEVIYERSLVSVITEASGRDDTLTGRTVLWGDLLSIASNHPILGVGYGSFWIGDKGESLVSWSEKVSWRPGQGHNGYIDVYVELGLVGVFLIIGLVVAAFKNIGKIVHTNFQYASMRLAFLITILVNNITESSFLRGTHNLWFLFLLVAINVPLATEFRELDGP